MTGMNRAFGIFVLSALILIGAGPALGEIPKKINYQGKLADSATGEPEAGIHSMVFAIYDDPEVGSELWSETQTVTVDSAGIFSAILGGVTPIDIGFDGPAWLEIEVGGETLTPRREIVSVPFAFHTSRADHAADSDSLGGLSSASYSLVGHTHNEYVAKGETGSVTGDMITDGEIANDDIAPGAGIDPSKIAGTAWTSLNDGAGSGLDADMVGGLHADAFADTGHDHNELYFTKNELHSAGVLNDPENPVHWTKLTGTPAGFADGVDDTGAGDGHSLDAADGDPVDQVFVDDEGNVGIGTANPGMRFDVAGGMSRLQEGLIVGPADYGVPGIHIYDDATGPSLRLTDASGADDAAISLMDGVGYNWAWSLRASQSFAIVDGKANKWRLFIDPSGNIGIGTTTPQRMLHIVGENPRVLIEASSMNPEINFMNAGDAPSDIWAIYKDSATDDLRFFQWGDKLSIENSTGNVGIGTVDPAVKLDVQGDVDVDSLYKIGGETVISASGPGNIRVGVRAGHVNGGKWTTLVGDSAGYLNHGGSNTFVGYLSGFTNSSGPANTFVGAEAGYSNRLAGANTCIGAGAGRENEYGEGNTFVGGSAGYNSKGGYNTFVGLYAGLNNDSGQQNVFIGNAAGSGNLSGEDNTYLGRAAGSSNQTGSGNVCIGYRAGMNEMGSNNLYIANGSDDDDVLIYGDFASGRIGMGTTNPGRSLHIVGDNPRILIEAETLSPEINLKNTGDADTDIWAVYKDGTSEDLRFYQGGDKVWIKGGSGNIGIGADPGTDKLRVQGSACATGGWNTCSDLRFKEDIEEIGDALAAVVRLRGVSFSWKTDEYGDMGFPEGQHLGVIAQEVEEILPQVVLNCPDGEKAVAYTEIIPVLIEAIKTQQEQIENMQAQVEELQALLGTR